MKVRATTLLAVLALIAAACGQKPGVHARAVAEGQIPGAFAAGAPGAPIIDPATGQYIDPTTGEIIDPAGEAFDTGADQTATTGDTGAQSAGVGGDSTGVTKSTITIGVHAPVTGAAPVRSDSFATGKDLYWKRGNNGKPVRVHGREVRVLFENDNYNPSTATQKCKQMAEGNNKAFLLIGGAGTDQIFACAKYAASRGIPYLSGGVAQNSLAGFNNYFALSMTYAQQAPLLAQYIKKRSGNFQYKCDQNPCRVVVIATDTRNFDDAVTAFKKAYPSAAVIRPSKSARGTQFSDRVCNGPVKRYDVVYPLTAPTFFLELEGSAACNPQYVGVGITMGLDTVASTGCQTATGSMHGSRFFSPAFSYDEARNADRAFVNAGGRDDIEWLLWGLMKTVHQMLEKAGPNPTRQGFMQAVSQSKFETKAFPRLNYAQKGRFGADQVNVLRAVCSGNSGRFVTEAKFRSGF